MDPIRRCAPLVAVSLIPTLVFAQGTKRPMTPMDIQEMKTATAPAISPNGQLGVYSISTPDWRAGRRQSDLYLVSLTAGLPSTRQLTFTKDKNEGPARFAGNDAIVFASDRDAAAGASSGEAGGGGRGGRGGGPAAADGAGSQLYLLPLSGGEAQKITDSAPVGQFQVTPDGRLLVYSAGRAGQQQLWALNAANLAGGSPLQLTRQSAPVANWQISKDSKSIFFMAADTLDADEQRRRAARFGVDIRNQIQPRSHVYVLDVATRQTRRLTRDSAYSVTAFTVSNDAKYIGYSGTPDDRSHRGTNDERNTADIYLMEVATGKTERLTNNFEVAEGSVSFSPDGSTIAYTAADEFKMMHLSKIYLRPIGGGTWRKIGKDCDCDVTIGWWSDDSKTIYFNEGVKATNQLMSIDVASGKVTQLTHELASVNVSRDEATGRVLVNYSDPVTPPAVFAAPSLAQVPTKASWIQLTRPNPQVDSFALGDETEITWKSKDGTPVGGVLVKPVGYKAGTRYPLIVAIHGGPAAADLLTFNGGYGSQTYAGAGYMVLQPNYRNSTNYGQKFKIESQGDYFTKGYEDIMAGVDYLIAQGLVDGNKMGVLGWSAGGHWSNWILTHTDRFKAISSGAGVANWVSMYAQSDNQRVRQWYLGDTLYFEGKEYEKWWKQSPIAYIKNAKTPTMIHVVDGDPRVPRPQSEEMHMALKRLGVPTELFVYPGATHGIPDPRDQYTKAVAEFAWMEQHVLGKDTKLKWADLLKTLDARTATAAIQP
ncbi:peptidase S9 [Gemmatimonadota bacterium]|nr:peptidase S9 [Gemmatimonadota bacterium]